MFLNCYLENDADSNPSVVYAINTNDMQTQDIIHKIKGNFRKTEVVNDAGPCEIMLLSSLIGMGSLVAIPPTMTTIGSIW